MYNARKNHIIEDMSIKQDRNDDRKKEGHKYIQNVFFHDGKASESGIFVQFSG